MKLLFLKRQVTAGARLALESAVATPKASLLVIRPLAGSLLEQQTRYRIRESLLHSRFILFELVRVRSISGSLSLFLFVPLFQLSLTLLSSLFGLGRLWVSF